MPELLKLSDTQRKDVANKLGLFVQYGLDQLGTAPQWWGDVERFHRNERPSGADVLDNNDVNDAAYSKFHIPFSQPRQDMLTAQVCTVVTKQKPYMIATDSPEDEADARQDLNYKVWKAAGFPMKCRQLSRIATDTDLAYFRITHSPEGIKWDVIHPKNVIVVPATIEGIPAAACVGHRFNRRRADVEAMQKTGLYYKAENLPSGDPGDAGDEGEEQRAGTSLQGEGPDRANDLLMLWELVVKLDLDEKGEKRYRATFNEDAQELLSLVEYEYKEVWYFRSWFIGSATEFYSASSVGRNLYPLQDCYNKMWSALYMGSMMSALKPMIGPALEGGEKLAKYGYGSYVGTDVSGQAFAPTVSFDGSSLFAAIQELKREGDLVARISQNTQGVQASETATEAQIIAAGVQVGIEEYIANFTGDFPRAAEHTGEIIDKNYQLFAEMYGEEAVEPPPEANPLAAFLGAEPVPELESGSASDNPWSMVGA